MLKKQEGLLGTTSTTVIVGFNAVQSVVKAGAKVMDALDINSMTNLVETASDAIDVAMSNMHSILEDTATTTDPVMLEFLAIKQNLWLGSAKYASKVASK
jgi:hypothetical protein